MDRIQAYITLFLRFKANKKNGMYVQVIKARPDGKKHNFGQK